MKKSILLMIALVASTASFAQVAATETPAPSAPQTRLVMTPDQKIKLFIQPMSAKGQIAILDAEGHALYTKTVALQKGLGQQFDVSGLGIGTYRVTFTTGKETVIRTFVVQPVPYQNFVVLQS